MKNDFLWHPLCLKQAGNRDNRSANNISSIIDTEFPLHKILDWTL